MPKEQNLIKEDLDPPKIACAEGKSIGRKVLTCCSGSFASVSLVSAGSDGSSSPDLTKFRKFCGQHRSTGSWDFMRRTSQVSVAQW